jgi:GDP-L-fucose synthase
MKSFYNNNSAPVYIAGHKGLVGSAIKRKLESLNFSNIIVRTREELDLLDKAAVHEFFINESPQYVFLAAARVGGIKANNEYPVEFLVENLTIQNNIIMSAKDTNVEKLLFLGSSCIYPKFSPQPIQEEYLLTGLLEPTNEAYAIAKISGINLCKGCRSEYGCNFISVMPTNLYGPNDNFNLESSHVLPAIIRKAHVAKITGADELVIWGSGTPRREFLHVDDLAGACIHLMDCYNEPEIINIGLGEDISIYELTSMICEIIGFSGKIVLDSHKPDGTPRKLLDISRLKKTGWSPSISLREGIINVYQSVDKSDW